MPQDWSRGSGGLGRIVDHRALRVVEAVAAAGDGVTAKAIARRLGTPLPTVYRTLGTWEVHTAIGAAAYYAVFRDVEIVVAHIDDCADHPGPTRSGVGEPTAPHATAGGKVMLAGLRPARLAELLAHTGPPLLAPRTVADRRALDRELMRIRSAGAAVAAPRAAPAPSTLPRPARPSPDAGAGPGSSAVRITLG